MKSDWVGGTAVQKSDRRAWGGKFVRLLSYGAATILLTAAGSCDDNLKGIHPGPVRFRVSIARNTTPSNGASMNPSISADGRYVVFASDAKNLAAPSSNFREIFLRDRLTDTVINVTRLGNLLNQSELADCDFPYISPNGNWVVFQTRGNMTGQGFSWPPPLTPLPSPLPWSVVRWDRVNDQFDLVLYWPDSDATNPTISDDGRWLAFVSSATTIGVTSNGDPQVIVADANAGFGTTLISRSMGTTNPCNNFCFDPSISRDGTTIVFSTAATDLTADTFGAGINQIFAAAPDGSTMAIVSRDDLNNVADNICVKPNVSGDGRYVCFVYAGGSLVAGGPPASVAQVVRRDRTLGKVVNAGVAPVALPFFSTILAIGTDISDDGRFVASWYPIFDVTGKTLLDLDVKVQDVQEGKLFAASVGILGTTGATLNSFPVLSLSADGRWVVFMSLSDDQVTGDSNRVMDIIGFGPMK